MAGTFVISSALATRDEPSLRLNVLRRCRRLRQSALPAQRTRSGGLAAAHIQDTFVGLEPKIISRESAEALPHPTYQVSATRGSATDTLSVRWSDG
jgi:hypothetical protein